MTDLNQLLTRAAKLRSKMEGYSKLKDELDEVKWQIQELMAAQGSKRTDAHNGLYATRSLRKQFVITNEPLMEEWLENVHGDLAEFYKLDTKAIEAYANQHLDETGELPPSDAATYETTEYVSLREEKTTPNLKELL